MRHLRVMSRQPQTAQYDAILSFISVIQAIIGLATQILQLFGINTQTKGQS